MASIRVVIADDKSYVRTTLAAFMKEAGDIELAQSTTNGADAIDAVLDHSPDIVVLDIDMPGLDCFEAAKTIKSIKPDTGIVILTDRYDDRHIMTALRSGALAFVVKEDEPIMEHIIEAIRAVANKRRYFSPTVSERIKDPRFEKTVTRPDLLSPREFEVIKYLAEGLSKKEISTYIDRSVKTVEKHTQSIMDKLDIHDRVLLARWFIFWELDQSNH